MSQEIKQVSKTTMLDALFHGGLWETRYIRKETAKELQEIYGESIFHADWQQEIEKPRDIASVLITTLEYWRECRVRKDKLNAELEVEKAKITARNAHIEKVRKILNERTNNPKLTEEFINRGLNPANEEDSKLRLKLKLDFVDLFNQIENEFKQRHQQETTQTQETL